MTAAAFAHLRIATVEIVVVLAAFLVLAWRTRARAVDDNSFTPLRVQLEVHENGNVRRVSAPLPLVVGRSSEADVPLLDPLVSRRHARLDLDAGVVYVTDLDSSNGTFLNGSRVGESIEVRPGDRLDVGGAKVKFVGTKTSWT